MKFKTLKAAGFGKLANWESPEIEKDMIVIYGPNESGKTTLFKLISTLLYGWSPASRDNNPYVPWGSSGAECSALILDNQGKEVLIHRRLKSKAEGSLSIGDKIFKIGNSALDYVSFLPLEIFNEVYALTIDQMHFPEGQLWTKLQDQLLGGQYSSFLKPVHEVAVKLQDRANSLWRDDNKGKPQEKQLIEKRRILLANLRSAEENEMEMRRLEEELENLEVEVESLLNEKVGLMAYMDRHNRLYPVKKRLTKIQELLKEAGNIRDFNFMPNSPLEKLREIDEYIKVHEAEIINLNCQREESLAKFNSFTSMDSEVYRLREDIKNILRSYSQVEGDVQELRDVEFEISRYSDRLRDRAKDILQGGWSNDAARSLKNIDEAELRACVVQFKRAERDYHINEVRFEGLKARQGGSSTLKLVQLCSIFLAAAGMAGIFLADNLPLKAISAVVAVLGAVIFGASKFTGKAAFLKEQLKEAKNLMMKCQREREEAAARVGGALKGLKIADVRLKSPDESLLVDINTLKEILYKLEGLLDRKDVISLRIEKVNKDLKKIMDAINMNSQGDTLKNISSLENLLSTAEERFHLREEARKELEKIHGSLKDENAKIREAEESRKGLLEGLEKIEGESLEEKTENLQRRRKCYEAAKSLKDQLAHDYPDIDNIVREIEEAEENGETWLFSLEEEAKCEVRMEKLDFQLNELKERIGSHKGELAQRQLRERMDDLKGQLESIEDERRRNAAARDRLMLLKNLLLEADKRFREENQPDLLLRAGNYLKIITNGRYFKLYAKDGGTGLMVRSNYEENPRDVRNPLSRGSLEQIYLALRLALVDHLDHGRESLPLFLDETLVNWDGFRTQRGIELLQEISKKRQVFLFTCHQWLKSSLSSCEGVQIIELH